MRTGNDRKNQESVQLIEELMEQERSVLEHQRRQAELVSEPKLKSLIARLSESHAQGYAELRTFLSEVRSQNEITRQINDMFL